MKLQFTHPEIREYAVSSIPVFKREDQPFDVIGDLAAELLKVQAEVAGVGMINVFEPAIEEQAEAAKPKSKKRKTKAATPNAPEVTTDDGSSELTAEREATFPDEFPAADVLAAAGFSYEEVVLLTREQLIEIKGIGANTADAILEYKKGE